MRLTSKKQQHTVMDVDTLLRTLPWRKAKHMRAIKDTTGLVNLREATTFLRISRSKLYLLMESGELPFVKLGKSRRVPMAALLKLIEEHTHTGRLDIK